MKGRMKNMVLFPGVLLVLLLVKVDLSSSAETEKKLNGENKLIACIGCEPKKCGATASTWKEFFRKFFSAKESKENLNKGVGK